MSISNTLRITWQLSNKYIDNSISSHSDINHQNINDSLSIVLKPFYTFTTITEKNYHEQEKLYRQRAKWLIHEHNQYTKLITEKVINLLNNAEPLDSTNIHIRERAYITCTNRHSIRLHYSTSSSFLSTVLPSTLPNINNNHGSQGITKSQDITDEELRDYYEESGRPVPSYLSSSTSNTDTNRIKNLSLPFLSSSTSPIIIRCGLQKISPLIHWESPLSAANRAEGLIMVYIPGNYYSNNDDSLFIYRCSPIDIQEFINQVLYSIPTESATDIDNLNNINISNEEIKRLPFISTHSSSLSLSSIQEQTNKFFLLAEMEKKAYNLATTMIINQRNRVNQGGELWTKEEKQIRLDRLKLMVDQISQELNQKVTHHTHSPSSSASNHQHNHVTQSTADAHSNHHHEHSSVSQTTNELSQALSNIATLTTDIMNTKTLDTTSPSSLLSSTVLQLSYQELADIALKNLTDIQKSILEAYDQGYNELYTSE